MNKLLIIYFTFVSLVSTENFCGNWEPFKDQKCVKVFNEEKLMTYEEAVELCSQSEKNVWLGLKNSNNKFEWIDKTSVEFTNWANGSLGNNSDKTCVEMITESSPIGKWFDIQCSKKNLVVCQKTPQMIITYLKKKLLETEHLLTKSNDLLTKTTDKLKISQKLLNETMTNCKNIWNQSNPFLDSDGKQRVFIFPLNENKNKIVNWDEANNTCIKYNATLVEINSQQKQNIFESFLKKFDLNIFQYFWLNGKVDSSGKWKWLRSGKDFTFTNWESSHNNFNVTLWNYLAVQTQPDQFKWYNLASFAYNSIICELEVNQ